MNSNFNFKDHAQTHQQQLHRHQRQQHQRQKTTLLEFYQKEPQKNQEWVLCSFKAVFTVSSL